MEHVPENTVKYEFDIIAPFFLFLIFIFTWGIGMGKMKYLEKEIGAVGIDMMKSIKKTFDPHWLMNPGKILFSD